MGLTNVWGTQMYSFLDNLVNNGRPTFQYIYIDLSCWSLPAWPIILITFGKLSPKDQYNWKFLGPYIYIF